MKLLLLFILAISISFVSSAAFTTTTSSAIETQTVLEPALNMNAVSSITIKDLQSYLGRKLTLKEKVQWLLAKKIINKVDQVGDEALAAKARNKAYVGFGLSLAGLLLVPFLGIAGLIISNQALALDKQTPGTLGDAKGYAQAGQIIGWVSIALIIVGLLLVLLFVAAMTR